MFRNVEDMENLSDKIVFPLNVHENTKSSGLSQSEKTGIFGGFWALLNVIGAIYLSGFLRQVFPKYYVLITLIIMVVVQLTIGVYILSIVTERGNLKNEIDNTYRGFEQYFGMYREMLAGEGSPYPFDIIEMADGSHVAYVQCLFGYNTMNRSLATNEAFKDAIRAISRAGLSSRKIFINESFKGSKISMNMMKPLENIEDEKLFNSYRDIVQHVMTIANDQSNIISCVIEIHAKLKIDKETLADTVRQVLTYLGSDMTAIRDAKVLPYNEIVELYRRQTKLPVIDMGRVTRSSKSFAAGKSINILRVYTKDGKSYTTKEYFSMLSNINKEQGLS